MDTLRLWFRIVWATMTSAIAGLNRLVGKLHDEARKHEDPDKPDDYDPQHAAMLREQANRYAETAEQLRKATEAAVKDQPGDKGEER